MDKEANETLRRRGGRPAVDDGLLLYVNMMAICRKRRSSLLALTSDRRTAYIDGTRTDKFGNSRTLRGEALRRRVNFARRALATERINVPGLSITPEKQPEVFEAERIIKRMIDELAAS